MSTKKSILKRATRSNRNTAKKRIQFTLKDNVKEFERDFEPSQKNELWTSSDDVRNAKLSMGLVDPSIIKDKLHRSIVENDFRERQKKHQQIDKHRKSIIQFKNLQNQIPKQAALLARNKIKQDEEPIVIKRQPILTTNMLSQFHKKSPNSKKGGKRRMTKKRFIV
uniref:Uncharacterized protein n=1 Tax=viral metagenome TaxID=1070528 RepID=A0A6C0DQ44_9ZZZZ